MAYQESSRVVNRRAFLRVVAGAATGAAVAGGIPAIVAAQKPPSFPKGTTLKILEWVSFVPASDVEFKRLAAEFGKLAGVETTVDQVNMNDHPMGPAFGHSLGDPNQWAYPVTWCFGGAEIDDKGKVVINSKQTIEALRFTVAFWKDCLDEGGLAWDDTSNNRAFLAGTISATINGASIYFVAKRQFPEIAKAMNHAHMPRGSAGRVYAIGGQGRAVMKYATNQQVAKEFLRWFMDRPQYDKWMAANDGYVVGPTPYWEKHTLWERDPKLVPFKEASKYGRWPGYPGPPSRKASEVLVKYILVDMYAQAIKGMNPEDAARWAEGELKKAYA